MAGRILTLTAARNVKVARGTAPMCNHAMSKIGNREVVGYGHNGEPTYSDRLDYPMPAIRYKENTPDIMALREKEKGDWKKLSLEEKRALYRASFCQTFSEFKYRSPDWKLGVGFALWSAGIGLLMSCWIAKYVIYDHPITLSEERKKAQLKRMLDLNMNPIHGIASKWDYENNRWK
ncbi:cytochrome c oxidase subunit 4 isoform 1, mitochondrial-like [Culicoides brevitarsis]|uniref:cytochrome c oxidase subunit 4 isoform 1, mitochondrial-like n=1 Tax=Culicoides brevitarsis TaxID=469753 RepID=UPI00307B9CBF